MSVIIEGFNKPKNCYSCTFNNSDCYCNLTKGGIDRDDWDCSIVCPIKEIPKGCGDLIDRDKVLSKLISLIQKFHKMFPTERLYSNIDRAKISEIRCCIRVISEEAAIIGADKSEREGKK